MKKETVAHNRVVTCPTCKKDIDVRSPFSHTTLNKHMKEHSKEIAKVEVVEE